MLSAVLVLAKPAVALSLLGPGEIASSVAGAWAFGLLSTASATYFFVKSRKNNAILQAAKRKLGEVEYQLNEAESALQSESQILLTWPSGAPMPDRIYGTLHGAAKIPAEIAALLDFASWLEHDSAARLQEEFNHMGQQGTPFNFGIKTLDGDLLEVCQPAVRGNQRVVAAKEHFVLE